MEVCVSECVVGPDQVQPKRWWSVVRRVACALTRGGREIEEERRDERERGEIGRGGGGGGGARRGGCQRRRE